jgi:hypothetical protein
LIAVGAMTLQRFARGDLRIRADAGAASSRCGQTLEQCLGEARAQVAALKRQAEDHIEHASRDNKARMT